MSRETVEEKAKRYLGEGRLVVEHVIGDEIRARCRGRGAEYVLGLEADGWYCSCPARGRCAHLAALELVVVGRRFWWGKSRRPTSTAGPCWETWLRGGRSQPGNTTTRRASMSPHEGRRPLEPGAHADYRRGSEGTCAGATRRSVSPAQPSLLTENERALEVMRLPRRKLRVFEQLNDLNHELGLSWRKRRRVRMPVHASSNVGVDAAAVVFECFHLRVKFPRSVEHPPEVDFVDRHRSRRRVPAGCREETSLDETSRVPRQQGATQFWSLSVPDPLLREGARDQRRSGHAAGQVAFRLSPIAADWWFGRPGRTPRRSGVALAWPPRPGQRERSFRPLEYLWPAPHGGHPEVTEGADSEPLELVIGA